MDLSRNSEKTRAWIEKQSLPKGWIIDTDGTGRYLKVTDTNARNRTMFHASNWRELSAWCEGVGLGRGLVEATPKQEVRLIFRARNAPDGLKLLRSGVVIASSDKEAIEALKPGYSDIADVRLDGGSGRFLVANDARPWMVTQ